MMNSARNRFILGVTVSYAVLALGWIFLSDQLLSIFTDIDAMLWLSTVKGVFFVVATTALFYLALRAVPTATDSVTERPRETLVASISPGGLPRWLTYAFAVAITLAMLLVRDNIVGASNRALLILFMFPIILSALFGGLGPGIVSTAVAAIGALYVAIPPVHSFSMPATLDQLQWSFLVANGVAVSVLSEVLKRSLKKAEMNRLLLDSVISGTSDAVFVKDAQGKYLLANTAMAEFVGRAPREIIGRDDRFLFPGDVVQAIGARDLEITASGRTQTYEEQLTTSAGKVLAFLVTKGPIFDKEGQVVGLFGIAREISERKRINDEIRRLNAELERRVTERTAELRSANLELEDLAYALTHNLRAPLRAIGNFAQLLEEEHAGQLDAEARDCLEQILQANGHMARLIEGILSLLRSTRGKLYRETVDISALATRRLDELAHGEAPRPITWQVEEGLTVFGDEVMLDTALTHLLENSWKFTRGRKEAAIRVYSDTVDGRPGICVADNGAGFDMAHAERLFQPFQRLHRQDEFSGVGIGLATVQRIIQRHGGELRADAAPGKGAAFCFSLPQFEAAMEGRHE